MPPWGNTPLEESMKPYSYRVLALIFCVSLWGNACTKKAPTHPASAPWPPAETVIETIAFGSCATQKKDQSFWDQIGKENASLFLFIGDNVYGDVSSDDPALPELRDAYATLATIVDFQRFRSRTPILPIWDDHDYGANDGGADFALKAESKNLFMTFWEVPKSDERRTREGLYFSRLWGPVGQRTQIILLDTRSFRSPMQPTDEPGVKGKERYVPTADTSRTVLGSEQWAWLKGELEKPAEIRLVISSYQMLAQDHGFEAWHLFPHEVKKFKETIKATGANGVVLLSGDRHIGALYEDLGGPYPLVELTSSSLNKPIDVPVETLGPPMVGRTYTEANYGTISTDWKAATLTLRLHNMEGNVLVERRIPFADMAHPKTP